MLILLLFCFFAVCLVLLLIDKAIQLLTQHCSLLPFNYIRASVCMRRGLHTVYDIDLLGELG